MSIFTNEPVRLLVQGITGKEGLFHAQKCAEYGTNLVAGVTPGKGGTKIDAAKMDAVPIFNSVREAREATRANATMIFVPPPFAADAIMEAADAGIDLIVCITEGIPIMDMMRARRYIADRKVRLIGPNCPGIITPGEYKIGIMPGFIHTPGGPIGVVSRSGTLTYESVFALTNAGFGQTTCVGIGGDPINGINFIDCLEAFNADPKTEGIVMIGEIGGNNEEKAAAWIRANVKKPVIGFIAGMTAPPGRRMGHAGAIMSGNSGTGQGKIRAFRENGVVVCENLGDLGELCKRTFR
jgi:succinyl-CoA synthetase alpha subunit